MSDEQQDRNETWVILAYFSNAAEAGMVDELLRNNGIDTALQGINFGGLEPLPLAGGYSEIQLLVRGSELDKAQELYDAYFGTDTVSLKEDEDVADE